MDSSDYENITPSLYDRYSYTEIPSFTINNNNNNSNNNNNNSNKSSPLKDKNNILFPLQFDSPGAVTIPSSPSRTVLSPSPSPSQHQHVSEYKRLERQYADMVLKNKHLARETKSTQQELQLKSTQLLEITTKLKAMGQDNRRLKADLEHQQEISGSQLDSWTVEREHLESKISTLLTQLQQAKLELKNINSNNSEERIQETANDNGNQVLIDNYRTEIAKLKKRCLILERENELEVRSKIMIIEELEVVREKYMELEEKFEEVNARQFDQDTISFRNNESESHDDDDECSESELNESDLPDEQRQGLGKSLADELKFSGFNSRISSMSSSKTSRKASRRSSYKKYLIEAERASQRRQHSQEMMRIKFQIKSLELQNEKLQSYIGFLLQHNGSNEDDGLEIFKDNLEYEYSDEINIQNARKNLRKVIRCASAMPIKQEYLSTGNREDLIESQEGNSPTESTVYTDENKDSYRRNSAADVYRRSKKRERTIDNNSHDEDIEFVELGDSDFTISGEDEEYVLDQDLTSEPMNDSLNVSFTMDLTPSLNIKKRKKSKLFKRTPKKQLQRLTVFSSPLNAPGSSAKDEPTLLSGKSSIKSLRKYASNLELIGELAKEHEQIVEDCNDDTVIFHTLKTQSSTIFKRKLMEHQQKLYSGVRRLSSSSISDSDSDNNDEAANLRYDEGGELDISIEEMNMFKIVAFKKLLCPKHFFFQCLGCELVAGGSGASSGMTGLKGGYIVIDGVDTVDDYYGID